MTDFTVHLKKELWDRKTKLEETLHIFIVKDKKKIKQSPELLSI